MTGRDLRRSGVTFDAPALIDGSELSPHERTYLTSVMRRLQIMHTARLGYCLAEDGIGFAVYQGGQRDPHTTIIVSVGTHDGERWLHGSIAHPTRPATYDDLRALHALVFGDRYAYQVFAPERDHININPNVLHLWGRFDGIDGRVLPNFGEHGTI